jgi:hypothetical protein
MIGVHYSGITVVLRLNKYLWTFPIRLFDAETINNSSIKGNSHLV